MVKKIKTLSDLKDSRLLYEKKLPLFGYMLIIIVSISILTVVIWSIKTPKVYIVKGQGSVVSTNKNYIMPACTGKISKMHMKNGDHCKKGDVLFTIKSTELDLQAQQLQDQLKIYKNQIAQYEKLQKSITDNVNYFSERSADDATFYNMYETYQSKIKQSQIDVNTYKTYGYTDEQIEQEIIKNESKVSEIHYSTLQDVSEKILNIQTELNQVEVQLKSVKNGQEEYSVIANASGIVYLPTEIKAGMVVQAASTLGSIAKENDDYEIISYLNVNDAPLVKVGDDVDIAVSGLTQTIYGTTSGTVTSIDSDVTTIGKKDESFFKITVSPNEKHLISNKGNKVNLTNGMAVESRIKYDEVSYFNYVLESLGVLTR